MIKLYSHDFEAKISLMSTLNKSLTTNHKRFTHVSNKKGSLHGFLEEPSSAISKS